ncbi:hypothetical protein [Mitsuokella multacida]|uniref:hypothetical protein n=1 Tax=Mitsuokella multacida TaxID=52226 RepID=UPI002666A450|nr:hypothetical protein [Mitsuokella multacida]
MANKVDIEIIQQRMWCLLRMRYEDNEINKTLNTLLNLEKSGSPIRKAYKQLDDAVTNILAEEAKNLVAALSEQKPAV